MCGASFSKKQRLNYHMRIHTGEGLLYCPLCSRPATNSYSLRKHVESHEQPLTKALTAVGFRPLLVSDPAFVSRALQALTQATLQTVERHENVPNSFIESRKNQAQSEEADLEDCSRKALTSMVRIDGKKRGHSRREGSGGVNVPFSLTKFLQGLLEQESQKVRTDRQDRRDQRMRSRAAAQSKKAPGDDEDRGEEDEEEEEEEELPPTIGDELVRQCLEIIMKDEPPSDDERIIDEDDYDDEDDDDDDECESPTPPTATIKVEREDEDEREREDLVVSTFDRDLVIKTEQHHIESDLEWGQSSSPPLPSHFEESRARPKTGIPKIKISRVARTDAGTDEDLFVAEIIKKT